MKVGVLARGIMETMDDGIAVGQLLVATPLLEDPGFRRSVVLLLEHDDAEGTVGVVLNRPTDVPVGEVLGSWADLVTGPPVVFQGGPVSLDGALALARVQGGQAPSGWRPLNGTPVGLLDLDSPPALIAAEVLQLRVFAGYSGWISGQLKAEIDVGAWYVVPGEAGDAFMDDPGRLWPAVLRRQGGDLALVATFPDDPTLN
jgi:putative transcriptional regulator